MVETAMDPVVVMVVEVVEDGARVVLRMAMDMALVCIPLYVHVVLQTC